MLEKVFLISESRGDEILAKHKECEIVVITIITKIMKFRLWNSFFFLSIAPPFIKTKMILMAAGD
jgi:hypothetical protein